MDNCKRFGYARIINYAINDTIVKIKPITVERYFENGFYCNDYEIIECYNFFTKENVNDIRQPPGGLFTFLYNDHDAYFDYGLCSDLTGVYEYHTYEGFRGDPFIKW